MGPKPKPIEERFWPKVKKTGKCWEWIASKDKDGYGSFQINNKKERAHRISYKIHFGDIPKNMHVCHRCDNPSCVHPNHLWLGTTQENTKDRDLKNRQWQTQKTHCPNNHLYDSNNTYISKNNARYCKSCDRERKRKKSGFI